MFVGAVVIHDQMDIQVLGHVRFDVAQGTGKFLMAMARLALRNHRTIQYIQGRKQRRGTVTFVIVGDTFDVSQSRRQHRLSSFQGLTLAFFVHRQNQSVGRRIQVQPRSFSMKKASVEGLKLSVR